VPHTITAMAFCPSRQRLYYGQSSGELCFWPLSETGTGTSRYVGSHKVVAAADQALRPVAD